MSDKTLYEIYDDIRENKDVDIEDLKLAVLVYRDLLWFSNHDLEEIYKVNSDNLITKIRYEEATIRYKKALDQKPRIWLGKDNIPGTEEYKKQEEFYDAILKSYEKWKGENN